MVDAHRRVAIPWRRDLPRRQLEPGLARQEVTVACKFEGRLAVDRHVECPEDTDRGKVAGNPRRHEVLDQRSDPEGLVPGVLLGAHVELPVASARGDIGLTDKDAALVQMLKVDREVRHLPEGLGAVLVEDDNRILEAEPGEIRRIAAPCALESLRHPIGEVELA